MPDPVPTAEPNPTVDPAADDAYLQQTLRVLLEAGTQLVQDLLADPALPAAAKAEPFDRLARAIRRTVVLARHVAEKPTKRTPSAADRRTQSRCEIIRDVEKAIETRAERPEQAESLRDELDERLDDPDFDRDLATRSIREIILDLKRDLGLEESSYEHHPRRTPADIRALNARAAATPKPPPDPDDPDPDYEPGSTRTNPLLARYREAADG